MDQDQHAVEAAPSAEPRVPREFPTGWVVAFSAVFVFGFAVIGVVLMSRRKRGE